MARPFQFSLAGILIVISIAAIYLALVVSPLRQLAGPVLVFGPVTAGVTGIIYGAGLRRAFAIGFVLPQFSLLLHGFGLFSGVTSSEWETIIFMQFSGFCCGLIGLAMAWWLTRTATTIST